MNERQSLAGSDDQPADWITLMFAAGPMMVGPTIEET
jgi:hypothetical protein